MTEIQAISPSDFNKYALMTNVEPKVDITEDTNQLTPSSLPSNNLPPVYDASQDMSEMKSGLGTRGAILLGLSMLAIGGIAGHQYGTKSMKSAKEALEKELAEQKQKVEDAKKLYEETKEKLESIQSDLDKLKAKCAKKSCFANLVEKIKDWFSSLRK